MAQHLMPAASAVRVLAQLQHEGVEPCVGGGWAVDALLGEQTREHSDLDLWLAAAELEPLIAALARRGLDRVFPWPGDRPWNFVLHDGGSLRVDLHLYEPLPDGQVHYGSFLDGVRFAASCLDGTGRIDGAPVRCEVAEWSLLCHVGYVPRVVDRYDVPRLCERFGLDLPEAYR